MPFFSPTPGEARHPQYLAVSPAAQYLVACSNFYKGGSRVDVLSLVEDPPAHRHTLALPSPGDYRMHAPCFAADDHLVIGVSLKSQSVLAAYTLATGARVWSRAFTGAVQIEPRGVTPDGALCVTVLSRKQGWTLLTLSLATGDDQAEPWKPGISIYERLWWDAARARLLVQRRDTLLDAVDPQRRTTTTLFAVPAGASIMAFGPRGAWIALQTGAALEVRALDDGALLGRHEGPLTFNDAAFSPDGAWLVTAETHLGDAGEARVEYAWREASTANERARLRVPQSYSSWGLAFDARGRCLAYLARGSAQLPHGILALSAPV